jgi:hypothetical protein
MMNTTTVVQPEKVGQVYHSVYTVVSQARGSFLCERNIVYKAKKN